MIVLLTLVSLLSSSWAISSTCFYLPNINLKGGTYDEFDASDITQCCIQCASQPCCAGYTYSKALKRCYMKSSINYSEQEDMMISGIRANANGGVGAKMKNVKIEGSGGSRIPLENSDECQQYCTAFGVYSWSPPRYDDGRTSGECSCMKRITAVKYHFGKLKDCMVCPYGEAGVCAKPGVVYQLECLSCGALYIGETG